MSSVKTFKALYDFKADEQDELELVAGDLIDVTIIHKGDWGLGVSRRTQKEGSFPWSYVEPVKAQTLHQFELITVTLPIMCWHTKDFIWGSSSEAYRCKVCHFTCHKRSKFFVENNTAYECAPAPRNAPPPPPDKAVDDWTVDDVRLFLLATHLLAYEPHFTSAGVTGAKLRSLNHKKLQSMGIEDTGHRAVIMACIEELLTGEPKLTETSFQERCQLSYTEQLNPVDVMDLRPIATNHDSVLVQRQHRFIVKSFSNKAFCDVSRRLLPGVERQGLQCAVCGLNASRSFLDEVMPCQPDVSRYNPEPVPPGVSAGHNFGMPITAYMHPTEEAPPLVIKIVEALEKGKGLKTSHLYKANAPFAKVQTLQAELLIDPSASLAKTDPLVLATLLKRFFAELPDSLITGEWYDRFIAAATLPTEEEQVAELDRVVPQLPVAHQRTLSYLTKHLGRVLMSHKSTKVDALALGNAWGSILLRPLESEAVKAAADLGPQANAVRLLIAKCASGGSSEVGQGGAAPPLMPRKMSVKEKKGVSAGSGVPATYTQSNYENIVLPRQPNKPRGAKPSLPSKATSRPKPKPASTQSAAEQLAGEPWFAGNMDRRQAEEALQNKVDGAFLVRASQTRRGYSMTVKYREIRHVVLVESNGKFGFTEPTTFDSISALVRHFEKVSLKDYNAELETPLAYPYKTAPEETGQLDYDEGPDDDIYVSNVEALRQSLARQHQDYRHNRAAQRIAHLDKQMKDLQRQLRGQQEIRNLLQEQLKVNEGQHAHLPSLTEEDRALVMNQYSQFRSMIEEALQNEKYIAGELEKVAAEDKQFRDENDTFPPEDPTSPSTSSPVPSLPPRRSESVASSASQASRPSLPPRRQSNLPATPAGANVPPDEKTSKYYVGRRSRDEAKALLEGCPHGTFLIRKSDHPGHPYSMSLNDNGVVRHIQIKSDGVRFGLAEPLAFTTLDTLCTYYEKETLSATINIPLGAPIRDVKRV